MEVIDDSNTSGGEPPLTESSIATEDDVMIVGEKSVDSIAAEGPGRQSGRHWNDNRNGNGVHLNRTYVQILNEMFPNSTRYVEVGRLGPAHSPQFQIAVHVNGRIFHGLSHTKQAARHVAAKEAIEYFQRRSAQPYGAGPDMRYKNRFDNYHRYQPYYRFHAMRAPLPPPPPAFRPESPFYTRRPYDPPFESEDNYFDDNWNREHNHSYYRGRGPPFDPFDGPPEPPPNTCEESGPETPGTNPVVNATPILDPKPSLNPKRDDFSSDDFNDDSFVEFDEKSGNKSDEDMDDMRNEDKKDNQTSNKKERIILRVMSQTPVNQNPVSVIHELQPNAKWVCTELTTGAKKQTTTFKMTLLLPLANEVFTGIGRTKKLAKAEAASKALLQMYNISINPLNSDNPEMYKPKSTVQIAQEPLILKQDIADRIGRAAMGKCAEVWEQLVDLKKWTVLAGIVLTDTTNVDYNEVICLTSGTKCVKGDSLSMNGFALNDCHAEVLARRAFIHYVYQQIEALIENNFEDKPEFIIERRSDGYGFHMKKQIKVNLFISTAPCGDSRVFSPKEEEGDAHPNRQTRGLLRAKIEGGEGTIPVKRDAILTWDGILQGHQRLQFMSCSDKIAVWNVVGIQGALMSHIMEPIYLESVVLASLFNYEHLVRAIHGRLNLNFDSNSLKGLPENYALNKSKVAKCQLREDITRQLTKAPTYAINWVKGDERPEVISTESGRTHIENLVSRLAKRSLFGRFCALLGRNTPTLPTCSLGQSIPVIYRDGKTASLDYQRGKTQCMQTFQEQNLGNWIQVPSEIDLFRL